MLLLTEAINTKFDPFGLCWTSYPNDFEFGSTQLNWTELPERAFARSVGGAIAAFAISGVMVKAAVRSPSHTIFRTLMMHLLGVVIRMRPPTELRIDER